jgi:hypothetical protein
MSDDPFAFPGIINSRELGPGHGKGFGFMKVYVVGYRTRKEDEPPIDPLKPWEAVVVGFSPKRGDWLIGDKEFAQRELGILITGRVHVHDHYCHFELEEEDGKFAIVCREHPEPGL